MKISDVKRICRERGDYFFDKDTMDFFNSVIESPLYKNRTFVTSERIDIYYPKRYTIRRFNPDGEPGSLIETVSTFQQYEDRDEAIKAAKEV